MFNSLAFDRALSSIGEERDVLAFDRLSLRHFDVDGRMHVERCNLSKANVCPYFGREIPGFEALGLDPNAIYKMYRDPEELKKGAQTFRGLQLLLLHTGVNAEDPKTEVTVGCIGSDVEFVAPYLVGSLSVWTAEGIKLIESKRQAQLSCSYRYTPDMTAGHTPEGVAFDGIMRDIMGNHVALVEQGRAGPDVYVSDSQPSELVKMKHPKFVAALVAALAKSSIAVNDEAQLALDACIEKEEAEDEDLDEEGKPKAKDKRAKDANGMAAGPQMGERGLPGGNDKAIALAVDAALAAKGYVTKTDADKLAADAATAAVARVNALHKAREDVKPLVGIVTFDSAEAVYEFALKQSQVALDGVPSAAYGALVEQVKARKAASVPVVGSPVKFANDAATAASNALPGLGRFQVAG
jgi:hypothetical protein